MLSAKSKFKENFVERKTKPNLKLKEIENYFEFVFVLFIFRKSHRKKKFKIENNFFDLIF